MREILFRGKSLVTNNWVYGNYIIDKWGDSNNNIIYGILQDRTAPDCLQNWIPVRVAPETIGQYTGLTDKNGTKVFEGDILQDNDYGICTPNRGVITYNGTGFCAMKDNGYYLLDVYELEGSACMYEVIGNIYDNPELLEGDNVKD